MGELFGHGFNSRRLHHIKFIAAKPRRKKMKKIFILTVLSLISFTLASCESPNPQQTLVAEMVDFLKTGRNNFTPNMEAVTAMVESGDFSESEAEDALEPYYCTYSYTGVQNEDGSYLSIYSYYEYDYDYYNRAQELLYNGIDDDEDGIIDEEDELLLMVTEEMTDGIDNNHNGLIDEYFEMTPKYVVNYTALYRSSITTIVSEDGTITTTGYWSAEWTEEKVPYIGQIIQFEVCY